MQIIDYENLNADFYAYKDFEGIDSVSKIIQDVKKRGDEAVIEYSQKFGDGDIMALELTQEEIEMAIKLVPDNIIKAIKSSIENVKAFAQRQFLSINNVEMNLNDAILGHTIIPLNITGAYVPGGNYPLPSSAIMSVVPAKVAGVKEVIVCSPKIKPETIAAAHFSGADKIFRVGGVQAIAAMAYGTETIPKVDKITGPGNKYVTAAKKEVYGVCGIDFLAGPSEVMIIADDTANAEFIAADMLAQCEHDFDARAYLVTNSIELAKKVEKSIEKFLPNLKTADIASKSIEKSIAIIIKDMKDSIEIANKKAPEHLEICFAEAEIWMPKFTNYGSLFIGNYSAEALGDYCSGTNHVLPTNGVARYSGGLSIFDFIKIQTFQEVQKGSKLFAVASKLAETEGLMAHKLSADLRFK
jgi:histidinol dehydrogenase